MLNLGLKVHRIVKLKYHSGAFIERHCHDYYHYIYVISGSGEIEIDRQQFKTRAGSLYLVPRLTLHGIRCDHDLTTVDIKFTCHPASGEQISALPFCVENLSLHESNIVKGLLSEAVTEEALFEEVINIRFTELMIRILRRQSGSAAQRDPMSLAYKNVIVQEKQTKLDIGQVLAYIEEHIHEAISIQELAQRFGYSESYFCTQFKRIYGMSPNKYINQVKINRAKDLMLYSKLNVTEIAELLGYDHANYFSRLFKKMTSSSPQQYIKNLNEDVIVNVSSGSVFIPSTKYEHQQKLLPR